MNFTLVFFVYPKPLYDPGTKCFKSNYLHLSRATLCKFSFRQGWESLISCSSKLLIFLWAKERVTPVALLSWASWANCSWLLFCKEQREQFAHYSFLWRAARANCSRRFLKSSDWVKSNGSNLLLGIKMWKGSEKHKKYEFFQANCKFLRAICSNHEQIALVTL